MSIIGDFLDTTEKVLLNGKSAFYIYHLQSIPPTPFLGCLKPKKSSEGF